MQAPGRDACPEQDEVCLAQHTLPSGGPAVALPGSQAASKEQELLFSFSFLQPHLWHVEVPRLGVELELQLPAYTAATATQDQSRVCHLCHSLQQHLILNPLSGARDQTRILIDSSPQG